MVVKKKPESKLVKLVSNPLVLLLSRVVQFLGITLAGFAVWIFQDMRASQAVILRDISNDLKYVNQNVANLKADMRVGNQQLQEVRERLKRLEDRVFQ